VFKSLKAIVIVVLLGAGTAAALADGGQRYGIGTPVTQAQIAPWDIDINGLTGAGLPPGDGSVDAGSKIWEAKCAVCHGEFGEGAGRFPVIAGGRGSLKDDAPNKTVGSYWPYAPTLFDYIKRAMPFPAPQSLTNDEVYALTAYILNLNDIVPSSAVMDATSLAAVKMPNRNGFVVGEWDTKNTACEHNCAPAPARITSDLVNLHVTPNETEVGDVGSTIELPTPTPAPIAAGAQLRTPEVTFAQVAPIIAQRCGVCHAARPTQAGVSSAPMGIAFDTFAEIKARAAQINAQSVTSQAMPLANITHMTAGERALIGQWIAAGAPLK
jgi:cytochrome c